MGKKKINRLRFTSSYRALIFLAVFIAITGIIFTFSRVAYQEKINQRIENVGINTLELLYTKTTFLSQLYSYSLQTASDELITYISDNATKDDYVKWLNTYYEHLRKTLFLQDINVYFANDNMFVDREYGDILETGKKNNYKSRAWYVNAIKNPGTPVFSEVYHDMITKRYVATASISLPDNKGVLAIDLHTDTLGTNKFFNQHTLDTKMNFLIDDKGEMIAFYSKDNKSINEYSEFLNGIKQNILESHNRYGFFKMEYVNGNKYSIFYKQNPRTKYYAITVIDDNVMHSAIEDEYSKYIIIFIMLAFAVTISYIDGYYLKKRADDSDSTVDMLGYIYYCIYRVNLENNTYSIVRSTGSVCKIRPNGMYEDFFKKYVETLDDASKEEFIDTFSLERLKSMSKSSSFNMDKYFHKIDNGENKWINIRIIRNKAISKENILLCFKECGIEREQELAHIELLEEAVEALKESAAAKRILYSSVSHDMRTPLNCIIGISELMALNIDDRQKLLDYIEKIKISGSQLLTLISNFLEMAQSESKALDYSLVEFNLENKINEICSLFHTVAERDNKEFIVDFNVTHKNIKGDANKLMHILSNILSNAFKYTKDNGIIKFTVRENTVPSIPRFQFIIEDNGIGMSEDFLKTIFTPFNRENRNDTKNITGAGLGLSIVNSQVKHMNGDIKIESQYEKGTKVIITLPFEVMKSNNLNEDVQNKNDNIDNESLSGLNVLVAEDNVVNMQILTELLKLKNINVTQTFNGLEAVNTFKNSKEGAFDILIIDIQMPVLNGLETAKAVRNLDRSDAKTVPIIALSANVFEEDVAASLEAGMNEHLAKPVNLPQLYGSIVKLVKNKRNI